LNENFFTLSELPLSSQHEVFKTVYLSAKKAYRTFQKQVITLLKQTNFTKLFYRGSLINNYRGKIEPFCVSAIEMWPKFDPEVSLVVCGTALPADTQPLALSLQLTCIVT
jgi:hypothetical protein